MTFTISLLDNKTVQLKWVTASESASSHFEIEKSSDGVKFQTIGKVVAAGINGSGGEYQFTDAETIANTTYYRLRQVDQDGHFKILPMRVVQPRGKAVGTTVYPNPIKGTSITVTTGDVSLPVGWQLMNAAGVIVDKGVLQQRSGQINVSGIKAGIYYLKVGTELIKLVK
jgi:hypothetical protein